MRHLFNNYILPVLFILSLIYVLLFQSRLRAEEVVTVLEPTYVSVEHWRYDKEIGGKPMGLRDPYLAPLDKDITFGIGLNLNWNLLRVSNRFKIYWDNHYYFDSAETHVRHVGWRFKLGASLFDKVNLYYGHESRHILEAEREERFPVYDRIGLELILLKH